MQPALESGTSTLSKSNDEPPPDVYVFAHPSWLVAVRLPRLSYA